MLYAVIVKADDWEGFFLDENLIYEAHEIPFRKVKDLCISNGVSIEDIEEKWVTDDYYEEYLGRYGSFPINLSEVEIQD